MAMTQEAIESLVRHQTYIERFGSGLSNRILNLFDNDELEFFISSKRQFSSRIKKLLDKEKKEANKLFHKELNEMARLEISFTEQLSKDFKDLKFTNIDIDNILIDVLDKPLIVNNLSVSDIYDGVFERKEEIAQSLNNMTILGLKSQFDIGMDINAMFIQFARGMKAANRTAAFATANEMRERAYQKSRAVDRVIMSAVLDGKTTPYCMNIDGDIFEKGKGPRPPFHANCRTIAVPLTNDMEKEDIEDMLSFRSSTGPGKNYEKGDDTELRSTKAQINKGKTKVSPLGDDIKSKATYADFLESQTRTPEGIQFIQDRLGVRKGLEFINRVKKGENAKTLLNDVLFQTDAKDLDLKGLRERLNI